MSTAEVVASRSLSATGAPVAHRLLSVDVLRGLCVAAMVLVNFPADWVQRYHQLGHAEWDGATATDMIFPEFLFLAGFSMTLSFASRLRRGESRRALARHVVLRSLLLFVLGLFLNGFPFFDLPMLHIPGVLQRIALCYLLGGLFTLATARRHRTALASAKSSEFSVNPWAVTVFMLIVLIGVFLLVRFVDVPGYGSWRFDHNGNLGAVIDRAILGNRHMTDWGGPDRMWDADGLLSCITSIPNLLLGVLIAEWMRKARVEARPISRTLAAMALLAAALIAVALCMNPYLVINRKIWTDSFTLLSSGISLALFTAFYWLLDGQDTLTVVRFPKLRWLKTPALVYGSNAILGFSIYQIVLALHGIYRLPGSHGPANWIPGSLYQWLSALLNPYNASLVYGLAMVGLILILLWPFYWKRIFIRL